MKNTPNKAVLLLLAVILLIVSCGEDPFFHHMTVRNYKGEEVTTFIVETGDYTFPAEMDGLSNILEWVYDGKTYDIGEKIHISENSEIKAITGIILTVDNGDNTTQSIVVKEGDTTLPLPEAPAERSGYVFDGWHVNGTLREASAVVDFSPGMTIEAKWTPTHTVTVDNGDDTTQPLVVRDGETTVTLPAAPAERDGYVFDGWLVNGTLREASAVVDFSTDMTVEAKWTAIYTITYDANGGTGTIAPTILRDDQSSVKLSDGTGYVNGTLRLTAWKTSTDGTGTEYKTGADYTEKADVTLYAVWTDRVTVSFKLNGGNGTTGFDDQTFLAGGKATKPTANPTHVGWGFLGWTDTENGTTAFNFDNEIISDTTLYAMWTKSYSIGSTGPAGGKIFYVNPNWAADGWRYLEASTADLSGEYKWGPLWVNSETYRNYGINYGTEEGVGKGKSNTEKLKNAGITTLPAAEACVNYRGGGYSDWFFPSIGELRLMYEKKTVIGNLSGSYWASTEGSLSDYSFAWGKNVDNGYESDTDVNRQKVLKVRPIRSF